MSKSILIVDDSVSIRQLVSMSLKKAGFSVVEAENGKAAMQKLDGTKFSLIISDVNMPQMNGIEFLKAVKADSRYQFTPVLMLTTESQESKKQEGKAAGAKAWLVKPFKEDILLKAVSRLA